jgi:hypothetical protein
MHTYMRVDGTFYDAFEAESPADETLPQRPTDAHHWDGRRWVWRGSNAREVIRRDDDRITLTPAQAQDIAELVAETHAIQESHGKIIAELRIQVGQIGAQIQGHLVKAEPLMDAVDGLHAIIKAGGTMAKIFNGIAAVLKLIWRFGLTAIGIYGAIWAVVHGDVGALRRAVSLMWGHPAP